ncbi:MAG TPA: OmpA family protein [Desulfomonilia bacterium]|jgi:flagellar motor protein MotB
MNRYLIIFPIILLITGCAHRHTESEYKTVETQLSVCEQACAVVSQDNTIMKARITALEEDLKKSKIDKDQCLQDMQGLLDRNIEALQYNKTLLQQMSSYKTIIQERKDTSSRSVKAYEYILNLLDLERKAKQVFIIKNNDKIKIIIPQRELFAGPKSAWLEPKGEKLIVKIAKGLKQIDPAYIEVGGHTDKSPIPDSLRKTYPNNWYLSQTRALSVLEALETGGINGDKMCAIAYADTRPIAANSTEEGMAMNRRVEISILP